MDLRGSWALVFRCLMGFQEFFLVGAFRDLEF